MTRDAIRQLGFFKGLDEDALDEIVSAARPLTLSKGAFLLTQDEPAERFFLLRSGGVRLTQVTADGHQVVVRLVSPGEGIGIIAVLGKIGYPVSAEIIEDAELLAWQGDEIAELMLRHPRLAIHALRLVSGRLHGFMDQVRELSTERVERRIAHGLLRLARQVGRREEEGILIDIPLTRQDLAEMTGTTVFTVSRTLSAWETAGWLHTEKQRVTILEPAELSALAEDLPPVAEDRAS